MDTTQDQPVSQDGYNTQLAGQSTMRFISIQGWPVHNPNIGLHPMVGQPAADEYNTRLASQSKMDTIHNWPVSQRWYNARPASQSKMDTIHNWPVSLQ